MLETKGCSLLSLGTEVDTEGIWPASAEIQTDQVACANSSGKEAPRARPTTAQQLVQHLALDPQRPALRQPGRPQLAQQHKAEISKVYKPNYGQTPASLQNRHSSWQAPSGPSAGGREGSLKEPQRGLRAPPAGSAPGPETRGRQAALHALPPTATAGDWVRRASGADPASPRCPSPPLRARRPPRLLTGSSPGARPLHPTLPAAARLPSRGPEVPPPRSRRRHAGLRPTGGPVLPPRGHPRDCPRPQEAWLRPPLGGVTQ
nr:proline-rich receptor-like protein kinase PERK9 [Vicugna pacos]